MFAATTHSPFVRQLLPGVFCSSPHDIFLLTIVLERSLYKIIACMCLTSPYQVQCNLFCLQLLQSHDSSSQPAVAKSTRTCLYVTLDPSGELWWKSIEIRINVSHATERVGKFWQLVTCRSSVLFFQPAKADWHGAVLVTARQISCFWTSLLWASPVVVPHYPTPISLHPIET